MISRHPEDPVSMSRCQPSCESVVVHLVPRVTELLAGRLLVAQFLSFGDAAGDGRALGYAAGQQADWLLLGRVLFGMDLRQSRMVCNQLAIVLAQKIEQGQYTRDEALSIARSILYETPQEFGMREKLMVRETF